MRDVLFAVTHDNAEIVPACGRKVGQAPPYGRRSLPSLQAYMLVAQAEAHVELFERRPDNRWVLSETRDLGDTIDLPVIGATLALADVYAQAEIQLEAVTVRDGHRSAKPVCWRTYSGWKPRTMDSCGIPASRRSSATPGDVPSF